MTALSIAVAALSDTLDAFEHARARAMLTAYVGYWNTVDCEVLAVEREFQAPLVRPDGTVDPDWLLGGKIDMALRIGGRIRLYDHKTSSEDVSPGSTFRGRLTLNGQASQYLIGARHVGIAAEDFVFDVLGKPGLEPLKATPEADRRFVKDKVTKQMRLDARQRDRDEYPAEFFERCCEKIAEEPDRYIAQIDVTRSEDELAEYQRSLYVDSVLIDTVREYGLVSRNDGACFQFGGRPCDYHPVCSATASIDDRSRYSSKRIHEELANPVPAGKRLLTNSRRASFNSCRQRHEYRYEQGIAAVERAHVLNFGTAVHSAVEAYWRARAPEHVRCAA